jgi:hypothetical protein
MHVVSVYKGSCLILRYPFICIYVSLVGRRRVSKPYSMIHVSFQMWVSKLYVESVGGVYDVGEVGVDCSLRGWYVDDVLLASPMLQLLGNRKFELWLCCWRSCRSNSMGIPRM